jgi:adenylate kinase family enzyme
MKIVILGSHGTGKTTLSKKLYGYLAEHYRPEIKAVKIFGKKI